MANKEDEHMGNRKEDQEPEAAPEEVAAAAQEASPTDQSTSSSDQEKAVGDQGHKGSKKEERKEVSWRKILNVVFWILIIGIVIGCTYIIVLLKAETTQCINNAFMYGANHQINSGTDVYCSCNLQQQDGRLCTFNFNKTAASKIECSDLPFKVNQ